ncbi:MAG: hypothetical protein WCI92_20165, partial [Bacteroidota bacterium]
APILAIDDNYSSTPINGLIGGTLSNVLTNDLLNGSPVIPGAVTITSTPTGPLTVNSNGTVTVAPLTAAGTYTITYTLCENLNPGNCDDAVVTVAVTNPYISGNVFNDLNRLTDGIVNGTGTNVGGTVYVNLVNPFTHVVISSVMVNPDGTYTFNSTNGLEDNTDYEIILSTTMITAGASLTIAVLPSDWISTGEHVGAGSGDDGTIDSKLLVFTSTSGVAEANFGIIKVPDITPVITAIPNVMHGATNFNITVRVTELNVVNTNGLITVRIPKDTRWVLNGPFNQSLTILGSIPVSNAVWTYSEDGSYHIFTTNSVITAGSFSTFGFAATFNPGYTRGKYTIISQIESWSGGENRISNNVDAEKLDYFIY